MKVWTCTKFEGFWPVGTSAVVVAEDNIHAALLLNEALGKIGLPATAEPNHMVSVDMATPHAIILCDGEY